MESYIGISSLRILSFSMESINFVILAGLPTPVETQEQRSVELLYMYAPKC